MAVYEKTTWVEGGAPGISAVKLNAIESAIEASYNNAILYADDSGTANAKVVAPTPASVAYAAGMAIAFKNLVENTGEATINVNGLGAKSILKSNGNALSSGNLKAGSVYTVRYNGTSFILQGEGGEYGTAIAGDVRSTKTLGTNDGVVQGTLDLTNLTAGNLKKDVVADGITGTFKGNYATGNGIIADTNCTVSGLGFQPAYIIIEWYDDSDYTYRASYNSNFIRQEFNTKALKYSTDYSVIGGTIGWTINADGFVCDVGSNGAWNGKAFKWFACAA